MRNTLLLQLPGVRKICLYYIAAPVLLLCLFLGTPARPTPRKLQILLPARPTVPIQMTI